MWEKLSIVLLLSVALTGCMGLQTGEEVGSLDQASDQPVNETDSQSAHGDGQTAADGEANGTDTQDDIEEEKAQAEGNQTGQEDATSSDEDASDGEDGSVPWTRNGSVELGWVAAIGANFTGEAPEASAQGQQDADHCPTARLIIPAGAAKLVITVAAQPVNASGSQDPVNATAPGAGLYTLYIETADGEEVYLGGTEALAAEGANLTYSTSDPVPGPWSLEMRPMGPVVQQTWAVDTGLSGQATDPPGDVSVETVC